MPAAGRGTRMGRHTAERPKALVPVAGEPLLHHSLSALLPLRPEEIVLVVADAEGPIRARIGAEFRGVRVSYVLQERPTGLAHAVLAAGERIAGPFVVANGDNVFRADLETPWRRLREEGRDAVVLTERVPARRARQGVCLAGPDGDLRRIEEHPSPGLLAGGGTREICAGFYAFRPVVFEACRSVEPSAGGEHELSDAVNRLLASGRDVAREPLSGWRLNLNTPEDVAEAERRLADSR